MRFVVLLGSPTGDKSVTLQYVRYLQKRMLRHDFELVDVGRRINAMTRNPAELQRVLERVKAAHGVIWAFPVYVALVPSQLKRFVELVEQRGGVEAFAGRHAAALCTSVHFYDHTALDYIDAVSMDFGMEVVPGYSAEMMDLLKKEERRRLEGWMEHLAHCIQHKVPGERRFPARGKPSPPYRPEAVAKVAEVDKDERKRVVLLSDAGEGDDNLRAMIEVFCRRMPHPVDVVHLDDFGMKGGCVGCLRCSFEGQCVYRDAYREIYETRVKPADAMVGAGSIRDRYFSARYKMYLDRAFYNGHRPINRGKRAAFLVSGPLSRHPQLRQVLTGLTDMAGTELCGFACDESGDAPQITASIDALCRRLSANLATGVSRPSTFLGVGGHKIFRDLVYAQKPLFREDYRFYSEHGLLDFPQSDPMVRLNRLGLALLYAVPALRRRMTRQINDYKVMSFKALVDRL